jgi:CBS domain-containing protein
MKSIGDLPLRQVPVVEPRTALSEAIELMRGEPLRTVVLVGDEQFMGVFNEDALLSNLIPADANLDDLEVGPYLLPVRLTADPAASVDYVRGQMHHRRVEILPVVRGGTVYLGVLTAADLAE